MFSCNDTNEKLPSHKIMTLCLWKRTIQISRLYVSVSLALENVFVMIYRSFVVGACQYEGKWTV